MPQADGYPEDRYAQGYRDGYRDAAAAGAQRPATPPYIVPTGPQYGPYDCPGCKVRPGQAHWDNCREVKPWAQTTWMGWK